MEWITIGFTYTTSIALYFDNSTQVFLGASSFIPFLFLWFGGTMFPDVKVGMTQSGRTEQFVSTPTPAYPQMQSSGVGI